MIASARNSSSTSRAKSTAKAPASVLTTAQPPQAERREAWRRGSRAEAGARVSAALASAETESSAGGGKGEAFEEEPGAKETAVTNTMCFPLVIAATPKSSQRATATSPSEEPAPTNLPQLDRSNAVIGEGRIFLGGGGGLFDGEGGGASSPEAEAVAAASGAQDSASGGAPASAGLDVALAAHAARKPPAKGWLTAASSLTAAGGGERSKRRRATVAGRGAGGGLPPRDLAAAAAFAASRGMGGGGSVASGAAEDTPELPTRHTEAAPESSTTERRCALPSVDDGPKSRSLTPSLLLLPLPLLEVEAAARLAGLTSDTATRVGHDSSLTTPSSPPQARSAASLEKAKHFTSTPLPSAPVAAAAETLCPEKVRKSARGRAPTAAAVSPATALPAAPTGECPLLPPSFSSSSFSFCCCSFFLLPPPKAPLLEGEGEEEGFPGDFSGSKLLVSLCPERRRSEGAASEEEDNLTSSLATPPPASATAA